jgi:uncharacterized membrane protein
LRLRKSRLIVFSALLLVQALFNTPNGLCDEQYTPQEFSVKVYSDGVADLLYKVDVDPTLLSVNVSLFGDAYENMMVSDQDGVLLDYAIFDGYVKIDVLGALSVDIEYTASDLTNKSGSLWILSLEVPVNTNIQLPNRATIISLNPTPIGISIIEESVSLTMPAGPIEVSYVLGVVGTKEHALALINEAETYIEEKIAEGLNMSEAEALLLQARNAYDERQYVQAEQLAIQAKELTAETVALASEANTAIEEAQSAYNTVEEAGRTSMLEQANEWLIQAQSAYNSGNYVEAKNLAEDAAEAAQESEKPPLNPIYYLVGVLGVGMIASIVFISRKGEKPEKSEVYRADLDKMFNEHDQLRMDEKEVLKFIAEAEAGVFVSEIRQRFDLPKSSAWRMIRRLENEELIEASPVGRETFVQIGPRYKVRPNA